MVGGIYAQMPPNHKKRCPQMSLKAAEISAFRAGDTSYKKADAKGLYLAPFLSKH